MVVAIIIMVLGLAGLILFLISRAKKGYCVQGAIIKSVVSLIFICLAAYSNYHSKAHIFGFYALAGLAVGMLGDIFLELKCVYKQHDEILTYAGFAAFFLGHIFYIIGMIREFYHGQNFLYLVLPLLFGIMMGGVVIFMEKPLKLKYGKMKAIVGAYGVILFSMAFLAVSLCIMNRFRNVPLILLGAGGILFALSDLVLSGMYFGGENDKVPNMILNISLYYSAQYLIAFSLFFL